MLANPVRLRLLALAAEEELAIGELAELVGESQPNVSRHLKPLRSEGLLDERREGTRVFVRTRDGIQSDVFLRDALSTGHDLCEAEGCLAKISEVLEAREAHSRTFFDENAAAQEDRWPAEVGAYLSALAPLLARRAFAIDAGTGDGSFLDVLAPLYERVLAFDRSEARVAAAKSRMRSRGQSNVEVVQSELGDGALVQKVQAMGGADAVFAARLLHHAPKPAEALRRLSELVSERGSLVVLDYAKHNDESMRTEQADVWLGFSKEELERYASDAGLVDVRVTLVPSRGASGAGDAPDAHLEWMLLSAKPNPTLNLTSQHMSSDSTSRN